MLPWHVHIPANTTLPEHLALRLHAHSVMPGKYSIKPFVSHFYTAKSIYSVRQARTEIELYKFSLASEKIMGVCLIQDERERRLAARGESMHHKRL